MNGAGGTSFWHEESQISWAQKTLLFLAGLGIVLTPWSLAKYEERRERMAVLATEVNGLEMYNVEVAYAVSSGVYGYWQEHGELPARIPADISKWLETSFRARRGSGWISLRLSGPKDDPATEILDYWGDPFVYGYDDRRTLRFRVYSRRSDGPQVDLPSGNAVHPERSIRE